jgi:hypothetical protein
MESLRARLERSSRERGPREITRSMRLPPLPLPLPLHRPPSAIRS